MGDSEITTDSPEGDVERAARHATGVVTTFKSMLGYARYLADQLELRDWSVWISERPVDPGAYASCFVWPKYRGVNIYLQADWRDWEAEDVRAHLLHELVHCYTVPMVRVFDVLKPQVGKLIWKGLAPGVNNQLEMATEGLAMALAPHLLIPQEVPVSEVPAYRFDINGEWFWTLDHPEDRRPMPGVG